MAPAPTPAGKAPLLPLTETPPAKPTVNVRRLCFALTATALFALAAPLPCLPILCNAHPTAHPARSVSDDPTDHLFSGQHGVVSSDIEECSTIGVNALKAGGNAVDAAIATAACIGTVNMYASGIGGGGFMVAAVNAGDPVAFNFREIAPAAAHEDMFAGRFNASQIGGLAAGVPGELHGFMTAHRELGVLPWRELWEPSIKLARDGFVVNKIFAGIIQEKRAHFLANRPDWEWLFHGDDLVVEGDVVRRPEYARTLEIIAGPRRRGCDPYTGVHDFYNGTLARELVATIQNTGGIVTLADMAGYHTETIPTIATTFAGRRIHTCPAPCSGPALLLALNIAEHLPLRPDPLGHHYLVESMKHLAAARTELGDPHTPASLANAANVSLLLSPAHGRDLAAAVNPNTTFPWQHYNPRYLPNDPAGTSHISVVDAAGGAASITTTINLYFGNLAPSARTGVLLNNQMDDFSIPGRPNAFDLRPSAFNLIHPGARPLSSSTPTIVLDSSRAVELVLGASGGSRIVTAVFQALVRRLRWDWEEVPLVKDPRTHHQLLPEEAMVEEAVAAEVVEGLRARGHKVRVRGRGEAGGSVLHVCGREDGGVWGVADWWRKGGRAVGY